MNVDHNYTMFLASSGEMVKAEILDMYLEKPLSACKIIHIDSASSDLSETPRVDK
jgi:hypothetical protein